MSEASVVLPKSLTLSVDRGTLTRDAADLHRVLLDFVRVYQLRDRDRNESHDVSASGAHALEILHRLGPISLNQLATELFVDKSTASRIVGGLEEKGYIRRITDSSDRRALRLEVTPTGRELRDAIHADAVQDTAEMIRLFPAETRRGMIGRLRQITGASATRAGIVDASCSQISVQGAEATTHDVNLRAASPSDREKAMSLLDAVGLHSVGLTKHFPVGYMVAHSRDSGDLAGLAGLERHGNDGLLRTVAVRPSSRGVGLARALVIAVMDLAKVVGIRDLYVLSKIAPESFAHLGWEKIPQDVLPTEIEASAAAVGRDSATATILRLRVS